MPWTARSATTPTISNHRSGSLFRGLNVADPTTQRIPVPHELADERAVHDNDVPIRTYVSGLKAAPCHDRDIQHSEVIHGHRGCANIRPGQQWLPLHLRWSRTHDPYREVGWRTSRRTRSVQPQAGA